MDHKKAGRSVGSVLLALLVVLSVVTAPVQPAAAQSAKPEDCSALDDFIYFFAMGTVNADDCGRQAAVDDAVQDMKDSDANQSKVDIYSGAVQSRSQEKTFMAPFKNYLGDAESVAWMKVETAVAEAYEDGDTKVQAKAAGIDAIENYYHIKQENLLNQWDTSIVTAETLREQARQEDGISAGFVNPNAIDSAGIDFQGFVNETITLVDGSKHTVRAPRYSNGDNSDYMNYVPSNVGDDLTYKHPKRFTVKPPSEDYNSTVLTEWYPYRDAWDQIKTSEQSLSDEVDAFVDATYADYETGKIDASDVIGTNTAMFEYGARSGNETESLWQSTAALSMMGYDTPNLNQSGMMTLSYDGSTYNGLVMAESAPNGSWQAGQTYDASEISGPVFMLTDTGQKIDIKDPDTFTVDKITAKDGSEIQRTNTTKYVYKTSNTTELLEMQEQLTNLRQEIEDRERSVGGPGAFDPGSLTTEQIGAGLAVVVGLFVIGRSS